MLPDDDGKSQNMLQYIVMDLINVLPGSRSVNTVYYATIEEAVFSMGFSVTSC
jgi:hypothetical protein